MDDIISRYQKLESKADILPSTPVFTMGEMKMVLDEYVRLSTAMRIVSNSTQ